MDALKGVPLQVIGKVTTPYLFTTVSCWFKSFTLVPALYPYVSTLPYPYAIALKPESEEIVCEPVVNNG